MKQILLVVAALSCGGCAQLIGLEEPGETIDAGAQGDGAVEGTDAGSPRDLDAGASPVDAVRRVFVTSSVYTGNLGGLSGADEICQTEATNANLTGSWIAWLADQTSSPLTRFVRGQNDYVLIDGTVIAKSWEDLVDGSLLASIERTPIGGVMPRTPFTWSNVASTGQLVGSLDSDHCVGWTSNDPGIGGRVGENNRTDSGWTVNTVAGYLCNSTLALYCFER